MAKAMARTPELRQAGTSTEGDMGEDNKVKALARGLGFHQMPNLTKDAKMAIFRSEGLKQNKCLPGPHLALSVRYEKCVALLAAYQTLAFPGFDSQTPRLHPESHFPSRPRPQSSPPPPGPAMVGADAESSAAVAAGEDHGDLALDSSSAASTDPLLHPPPSPSSTPSSPTAIADHDAFIEEDGEDDSEPAPAPHVPSASDEATPEFVQITVSEPKKHAEPAAGAAGVIPGSGSYFSYLITTRAADGGLFRVRRRFRDVVALADRLAAAYRGLFVPARPDKSIVEGQVMQRHEFVNQRCAALQRYLGRLSAHPTIGRSAELHDFLTEPSGIPTSAGESPRSDPALSAAMSAAAVTAPTAPAKPGRDFFGMFKDLKQTVANGLVAVRPPPVEEETDAKFVMHKAKLEYFEQHLTTASQQVEALLKAYDDLKATTGQLGMTFIKLAKFEKEQDTCNSQRKRAVDMSNFANAVINVSRLQTKLNAKIEIHLGTIYEYLETMTSVHNAFTDRANALLRVQSLSGDLFLLHTQAAKLESVSSRGMGQERLRYQKIEELKETIRKTEDAKGNARQEYELIKENNMNEIIRFNKEKRHGLVEMLKGFVRNQVSYSEHISSIWTKVAEETKGYTGKGN
uniref:PX domain-containing protein n=1 Tax=Oryza meridionalis TaxID=40149 RepID=A0A0E0C9P4_9ORYZ